MILGFINYYSIDFRNSFINKKTNQFTWVTWVFFALTIVTEIAIFCYRKVARLVRNFIFF